jgi:hypothetical protein
VASKATLISVLGDTTTLAYKELGVVSSVSIVSAYSSASVSHSNSISN